MDILTTNGHDTRRTGADTRQRILALVVELFSSQGYAGTSIRDITVALGMTKASLYYYFESKEQILDAVTEPLRTEIDALVERAATPPPPPRAQLLTDLVDVLSRHALLMTTVFNDPSAFKRDHHDHAKKTFRTIEALLAGSGSPEELLRSRCAMGAVQAGVLRTVASDPARRQPLTSEQAARLLDGKEHALDEDLRRAVVAAALRTLG
jgi:TetR/AcrR family transcriptional regulator, regulator of cefoperazone and chloramphenicol sensitivity